MVADLLTHLAFGHLFASLAILLVLMARRPVRKLFGAEVAYLLWLLPLAAGVAALLPARAAEPGAEAAHRFIVSEGHAPVIAAVWILGAVLGVALLIWSQSRFMAKARAGQAGPAVVGALSPRMVVPSDYELRFNDAERAIIRAHERAHIERLDPRANAIMALIQCLGWFNPLIHLAVREARLDQELACDARVMARLSRERRLYANTLLKTQLGARDLPLGCHWPADSPHPLEERVIMLARPEPTLRRSVAGGVLVMALSLTAAVGAWSAQPLAPPPPKTEPITWPVVIYANISVAPAQ